MSLTLIFGVTSSGCSPAVTVDAPAPMGLRTWTRPSGIEVILSILERCASRSTSSRSPLSQPARVCRARAASPTPRLNLHVSSTDLGLGTRRP